MAELLSGEGKAEVRGSASWSDDGTRIPTSRDGSQGARFGTESGRRTRRSGHFRDAPCVDGSPLARAFFGGFCKAGRCGHVFDLLMRRT